MKAGEHGVVPTLIVSGPVGVGKTAAALELGNQLGGQGIAHAVVDLDALTMCFPRPDGDPFGEELAVRNLADVWRNSVAACDARNLVVARVIEDVAQVRAIALAVPGSRPTVARLAASDDALRTRVGRRELGTGRAWHEARALHLSRSLTGAPADLVIDTDGMAVEAVALRLFDAVTWVR